MQGYKFVKKEVQHLTAAKRVKRYQVQRPDGSWLMFKLGPQQIFANFPTLRAAKQAASEDAKAQAES
jgi:hypothetical protein